MVVLKVSNPRFNLIVLLFSSYQGLRKTVVAGARKFGNTELLIYALLLGFWSVCEIQVLARQIQSISFSNYLREANFLADSLASLYWRSPFLNCWSSSSWSVGVEVFVGILICKCCPLYEEENITLDSSHFSERIVIVIDNIIHSKFAEPTSQHIYKSNTQRDIIRTLNFV